MAAAAISTTTEPSVTTATANGATATAPSAMDSSQIIKSEGVPAVTSTSGDERSGPCGLPRNCVIL